MGHEATWFSLYYALDEQCWGYLIEHVDDGVYSYRVEDRWVVPSFRRFEHAAQFVRQFRDRPGLERGGSYELGPAHDYATQAAAAPPDTLEDVWWFLVDVADAAEDDALLEGPEEAAEPRQALAACFAAFHRAVLHIDG